MKAFLFKYLRFLVFLPNINPFSALFSSEIFPWGVLFGQSAGFGIPKRYIHFLAYVTLSGVLVFFLGKSDLMGTSRAASALVNATLPLGIILLLDDDFLAGLNKAFHAVFYFHLVLIPLQYLGWFPHFLTPFFGFFIERFTSVSTGDGRGVAGLFAEPSYLGIAMMYFPIYKIIHDDLKKGDTLWRLWIWVAVVYEVLLIRSVTGTVFLCIYLLSTQSAKRILPILGISFVALLLFLGISKGLDQLPRPLEIWYQIIYQGEYKNLYGFLLHESGFRLVSILGSYSYGVLHLLGSGIGLWGPASIVALDNVGIPATDFGFFVTWYGGVFEGVRPTAIVADIMLECGLVGTLLFGRFLLPFIRVKELWSIPEARSLLIIFLFNILFLGNIGDPTPFVFLGLTLRKIMGAEQARSLFFTPPNIPVDAP